MKGSGVDIFISAAFSGLAGIISGKSWNNALRTYRLIPFFPKSSDKAPYNCIRQYVLSSEMTLSLVYMCPSSRNDAYVDEFPALYRKSHERIWC